MISWLISALRSCPFVFPHSPSFVCDFLGGQLCLGLSPSCHLPRLSHFFQGQLDAKGMILRCVLYVFKYVSSTFAELGWLC